MKVLLFKNEFVSGERMVKVSEVGKLLEICFVIEECYLLVILVKVLLVIGWIY